jgi:hypothetical protein
MTDEKEKGRCAKLLHWYLNDRISLAFSAAFACGLLAFFMGTIVASLFAERLVSLAVGGILAVLAGAWAARDQLRAQPKEKQLSYPGETVVMRWLAGLAGAGSLAVGAGQVLGLSGNWLVFGALIVGALISALMALILDRH